MNAAVKDIDSRSTEPERREVAILAADVVGYSRLTEIAEERTYNKLRSIRVQIVDPLIVSYRGQIVKNTGDGFIAVFDSPLDALNSSVAIQNEITLSEHSEERDRRIRFRMAVHVGEVIRDPEDVYGSSVNIAARLEQHAPPGGVVLSAALLQIVKSRIDVPLVDLGPLRLKGISRPVRAHSLHLPGIDRDIPRPARSRTGKQARVPSVAVLPFRSGDDRPEDAYFGEGMVDDIIAALASIRGLLVIARTSALAYRTGPIDVQKIGQDLGVRYVLSGRVRRDGERVRINSELTDVETMSVIWADRYDGLLSELFDLQDRIATRIVWSIAPHIQEAELQRARRKRPENLSAYDLVLQSIDLLYRMNHDDFMRAGELLNRAIAADERYPVSYAYAALWQIHRINQGWEDDHQSDSGEALRLAETGVALDPTDGFCLAVLGHARSLLLRDYEAGIEVFDRALLAAPSNAIVWTLSSGVFSYAGQAGAAITRAEMGLRLSPIDKQSFFYLAFLSLAHYSNGTYEEAVTWARKSINMNPRLCSSQRWLIASLVALGEMAEARRVARSLLVNQPHFRVTRYAQWCPLRPDLRSRMLERLRSAGIPD